MQWPIFNLFVKYGAGSKFLGLTRRRTRSSLLVTGQH